MKPIPGVTKHAMQRAEERLGFRPRRSEWLACVLSIIDRTAVLVRSVDHNGAELWLVRFGEVETRVWWSPETATIMTVLAPEMRARGAERVKADPVRVSHERRPRYHRGRFLARKTIWDHHA